MKYLDILTGEQIIKTDRLFAEVTLNESSIGDDAIVKRPFVFTNAKQVVVRDEKAEQELKETKKELDRVKLERRKLKKEVKALRTELEKLEEAGCSFHEDKLDSYFGKDLEEE